MYCQGKYLYILCFQNIFSLRSYRWYYMYITTELVLVMVILMALKYLLHYNTFVWIIYISIIGFTPIWVLHQIHPDSPSPVFVFCTVKCPLLLHVRIWWPVLPAVYHNCLSHTYTLLLFVCTWSFFFLLRCPPFPSIKKTCFVLRVPGAQWQCCRMG